MIGPRPRNRDQRSARRRSLAELADARRVIWRRDEGRCVVCAEQGAEVHHRRNRGIGGATRDLSAHAFSRLVLLCRVCHDRVGAEPAWAERIGLWVRHDVRACWQVPLLYRGVWMRLDDDGGITREDI